VRERERGTIEQLIVTPIRAWELLVGKLVPYVVIGFGDALEVLVLGTLWFHVPVRGNIGLLLGLALATKTLLDLEHHQFTEMSYGLRWRGACNECWSLTLVYQQFPDERQVSFLITLRGVSGSESKGVKELFLQ